MLIDQQTEAKYVPLNHIRPGNQAVYEVHDSPLSELSVLGFEYGFSSAEPNALVLWEAQCGDFANGAQVVIDQFIASGEVKWGRVNGITLMLPHGYEGQGPEHSSARVERFMQLAADTNMQIVQPTTASQIFHVLRRQMVRNLRKPLIIMTPKSLLRAKFATSPTSDFTNGTFTSIIGDTVADPAKVTTVLLCSGKIFFELKEYQQQHQQFDTAVVRLEQLYPLPLGQLQALHKKYGKATWYWVQEEPLNMGAASFLQMNLKSINYGLIGRQPSAATATGHAKIHKQEQEEIIMTAFSL